MGGLARQGALRLMNRIVGGLRSRQAAPEAQPARLRRPAHSEPGDTSPAQRRSYRQLPAAGVTAAGVLQTGGRAAFRELPSGGASALPPTSAGQPIGAGLGGGRRATTQSRASLPHNGVPRAIPGTSLPGARTPVGSMPQKRRAPGVTVSAVTTGGSAAKRAGRSGARSRAADMHSSSHRYDPRQHVYSASLRDGPPKISRERRRPTSAQQRRFRDYSTVTRDGVTVLVPNRK